MILCASCEGGTIHDEGKKGRRRSTKHYFKVEYLILYIIDHEKVAGLIKGWLVYISPFPSMAAVPVPSGKILLFCYFASQFDGNFLE